MSDQVHEAESNNAADFERPKKVELTNGEKLKQFLLVFPCSKPELFEDAEKTKQSIISFGDDFIWGEFMYSPHSLVADIIAESAKSVDAAFELYDFVKELAEMFEIADSSGTPDETVEINEPTDAADHMATTICETVAYFEQKKIPDDIRESAEWQEFYKVLHELFVKRYRAEVPVSSGKTFIS